jgi:hypothetical protein
MAAAVISLAVIAPWWNTINPSSRVWASLVDLAVIVALAFPWSTQVTTMLQE